jgi:hypothetical protein
VLFQFQGAVVASAEFEEAGVFEKPKIGDTGLVYHGALYFRPSTICVFDPFDSDMMDQVWFEFKRFNQVKQSLNPQRYKRFLRLRRNVRTPIAQETLQ